MVINVTKFPNVPRIMIGGLPMTWVIRTTSSLLSVTSGTDVLGGKNVVQLLSGRVRFSSMVCMYRKCAII